MNITHNDDVLILFWALKKSFSLAITTLILEFSNVLGLILLLLKMITNHVLFLSFL